MSNRERRVRAMQERAVELLIERTHRALQEIDPHQQLTFSFIGIRDFVVELVEAAFAAQDGEAKCARCSDECRMLCPSCARDAAEGL